MTDPTPALPALVLRLDDLATLAGRRVAAATGADIDDETGLPILLCAACGERWDSEDHDCFMQFIRTAGLLLREAAQALSGSRLNEEPLPSVEVERVCRRLKQGDESITNIHGEVCCATYREGCEFPSCLTPPAPLGPVDLTTAKEKP